MNGAGNRTLAYLRGEKEAEENEKDTEGENWVHPGFQWVTLSFPVLFATFSSVRPEPVEG